MNETADDPFESLCLQMKGQIKEFRETADKYREEAFQQEDAELFNMANDVISRCDRAGKRIEEAENIGSMEHNDLLTDVRDRFRDIVRLFEEIEDYLTQRG